jgi:hypothetical protein
MPDLGNRAEDSTIDFTFLTTNTSAVPTTLAGTPVVSVYKANGATESVAGVTLTVDFDGKTGLNHVRIDTSADAFYAIANDYSVVITTGTVATVSVVGATVGTFSIENRFDAISETQALPAQGAPSATPDLKTAIMWLYKSWRNLKDNDGTTTQLYDDAGTTVDSKQTTSEAAGTVTKAKWISGP